MQNTPVSQVLRSSFHTKGMQKMKALVVGGNGFIGSHLVDRLVADEWDVSILHKYEQRRFGEVPKNATIYRGDLTQESLVREALEGVDIVFHLLWTTTAIHEVANRDPIADVQANMIPTIGLMEACVDANIKRLVFTSSGGTVYGSAQELPILESHPSNPLNAYGVSKLAVEKYLQMFHHLHGLDYVILRPSVPYGPRQNPLGRQGAPAVFTYRVAHEEPIMIWGDGLVTRDYFFITDLIESFLLAAKRPLDNNRTFNIGGGKSITLLDLIRTIEKVVGKTAVLKFKEARDFDAPNIVLDSSRAKNILGWSPSVSLEEGIAHLWDWMAEHIP